MGIENFNNHEQPQERIKFFKKGDSYGRLTEEDRYDIHVISEGLHLRASETISGQFQQTVSLFYLYPIGDNYLKIKMRELLIKNIDILSKRFDGFANLDIVKKYKSDILILKDKCLTLMSDFMNGNEEDKKMINQYNTIKSEIKELYNKMCNDEDLKDYQVVHLRVKNLEDIDSHLQKIKEKHKNGKKSESYQDLSSDENNQEITTQSAKEECRKSESYQDLSSDENNQEIITQSAKEECRKTIQRIKKFLGSILNKTK